MKTTTPLCDWPMAVELACQHANNHDYADQENRLELAADCLARLGWGDATFGIEHTSVPEGSIGEDCYRSMAYLNAGETYELTVLDYDGQCHPGTWGDWIEGAEQEYESETGTIRCGYCGYFTPMDKDNWRDTVCELCNHLACTVNHFER